MLTLPIFLFQHHRRKECEGSEAEDEEMREDAQMLRQSTNQDAEAGSPVKLRRCGFCGIEVKLLMQI